MAKALFEVWPKGISLFQKFNKLLDGHTVNKYYKRDFHLSKLTYLNCHRSAITKIGRLVYTKNYAAKLVYNNGSSINIKYHEPKKIIKLPLDLSLLTEEMRRLRLSSRKPKHKVVLEDDIEDTFDLRNYQHLWKSKI